MFRDTVLSCRIRAATENVRVDVHAFKRKVSNLVLQKPTCNVDLGRTVAGPDAQNVNIASWSRSADATDVPPEQLYAVAEAERLEHRVQVAIGPICRDRRQPRNLFNL